MDGYRGRDYYTAEEFKSACNFNYWYGAVAGIIGTAGAITMVLWVCNII